MSKGTTKRSATSVSMVAVPHPLTMLVALVLGAVLAYILLSVFFGNTKTNFEDASAFGAETTSIFAKIGEYPIHCTDSRDSAACIAGVKARKAEHSVLWLGNSQVHAVNQWQQGDTNAVPILFEALKQHGLDLLAFSQPNGSLQEHYVLFEYLQRQLPLRDLILPVVFDDFREEGLRNEVALFARDNVVASALSETEIGRRLVTAAQTVPKDSETAGIAQTIQERVERSLNVWLEKNSSLWKARPEIRGQLIYGGLYSLRNALLGIKATSKRKMMPGRYRDNLAALEAMLVVAERNSIGVALYVAPFRGGVENPYVDAEYAQFKADVETLAARFGAVYTNLESLIPAALWGVKSATNVSNKAEVDFMHFQAGGHKLLARRLEGLVIDTLESREKAP